MRLSPVYPSAAHLHIAQSIPHTALQTRTVHGVLGPGDLVAGLGAQKNRHLADVGRPDESLRRVLLGHERHLLDVEARVVGLRARLDLSANERRHYPAWADRVGRHASARRFQGHHLRQADHAVLARHVGRLVGTADQAVRTGLLYVKDGGRWEC